MNFYKTLKSFKAYPKTYPKRNTAPPALLFCIIRMFLGIVVFLVVGLGVNSLDVSSLGINSLSIDSSGISDLDINNFEKYSLGTLAYAQLKPDANKNEPIEITADGSLEWRRNENLFIARKNALAVQGDVSVAADVLTANYRDGDKSGFKLYRVTANTNAVIQSKESKAYGDDATYNLDNGLAVMTGKNLRLVTTEQTITAKDRFEYWVPQGKLIAIGKAKITRPTDTLEADIITATLKENANGERVLETLEAEGNVVITTPTEILTGNYGIYHADTNMAEVKGNVTGKRGKNILQGERAEINLNTNISKMFGADGSTKGRVRGVFYPEGKKKTP